MQHNSPHISMIEDIRLLNMKVLLVCEWDRWSSPAAMELDKDIEEFLIKNGIDRGLALLIRISKYLSIKLSLPNSSLAKKIYT